MKLNGAKIILECLKEQGVDTVFGFPGGAILNLYNALYDYRDEIHHVLTSHEQGAAHAADGYARASGKVGVCFATSGPGATNLVTGIATSYMDSTPMVAITCNVTLPLLGKDSFQEVDIAGVTMPVTKHNFIVKDIKDLAPTLRRAFRIAQSGRPGPVLVDVPKNITAETCEYTKEEPKVSATKQATPESIKIAAELINSAKKPFMFVGGGAVTSGASKELAQLADKCDAFVCDSLMGKGAFPGTDPRYTGMLGMHGTKVSNLGMQEADLLIAMGTRFSDRVLGNAAKFAKNAKIVQFDIDMVEINKNITVDAYVLGDLKDSLDKLLPLIEEKTHEKWHAHMAELNEKYALVYPENGFTGPGIIEETYKITEGKAVIVTEVGQHQMWAAQYYKYTSPRQFISSGGLGTMGFGLGAAIGAKMAVGDKCVINIAGDGCFRMNMHELLTAKREGINLIEIIINNTSLGMVRQWQELFYEERYSATLFNDDVEYHKIAEAMGVKGIKACNMNQFKEALQGAMESGGVVVIDARINRDHNVWPMVAPGESISKTFGKEDMK